MDFSLIGHSTNEKNYPLISILTVKSFNQEKKLSALEFFTSVLISIKGKSEGLPLSRHCYYTHHFENTKNCWWNQTHDQYHPSLRLEDPIEKSVTSFPIFHLKPKRKSIAFFITPYITSLNALFVIMFSLS